MTSFSSGSSDAVASGQPTTSIGASPLRFARIAPEWQGEIAVCVGSGPSLTHDDVLACGDARLLAVSDAIRLAPWADVLYAADGKWWADWRSPIGGDRQFTLDPNVSPPVELLNFRPGTGLSLDPTTVMTGGHGGYQAINLAAHYRPRRIVLLAYDMMPSRAADGTEQHHFFGNHADGSHVHYEYKLGGYATLRAPLAALGIEIVNASRVTAIPDAYIPRMSLEDALR